MSDADTAEEIEALKLLDVDHRLSQCVPKLAVHLHEALSAEPEVSGDQLQVILARVSDFLGELGCSAWAGTFEEAMARGNSPGGPAQISIHFILGRAAGEMCRRFPGEKEWRLAGTILGTFRYAYREFLRSAFAALSLTDGAADALTRTLEKRVAYIESEPERVYHVYTLSGLAPTDRLRGFWHPRERSGPVKAPLAYELLRLADPDAYLKIVARLSVATLMQQIVYEAVLKGGVEGLTDLLGRSPPAFDEQGGWLQDGGITIILLSAVTDEIARHMLSMEGKLEDRARVVDALEATLKPVLDVVLARADGMWLGYSWLQYLVHFGSGHHHWLPRGSPESQVSHPLARAVALLAQSLPNHPDPQNWTDGEETLWRNERVISVLSVAAFNEIATGQWIGKVLIDLLAGGRVSDFRLSWLASGRDALHRDVIAAALAKIDGIDVWFKEAWAKTYRIRERERWHHMARVHEPKVAQTLVFWIMCIFDHPSLSAETRINLWTELESAIRESEITALVRGTHDDPWSVATLWLAAHWPAIYSSPPEESITLEDFIAYRIAPTPHFARLVLELLGRDVSIVRLRQAGVGSVPIIYAIDELKQARPHEISTPLITRLEELAKQLKAAP